MARAGEEVVRTSSSALLKPGQVIGGIWEVTERIGHGTFSEIYLAVNKNARTKCCCALKVDRPPPPPKPGMPAMSADLLKWEADILLKMQKYPFVARHYGMYDPPPGSHLANAKMKVLAMGLLGPSLSSLRAITNHPTSTTVSPTSSSSSSSSGFNPRGGVVGGQFTFGTCIQFALQMLTSTEALHQEGYIHRDLKPSNFVIGLNGSMGRRQLFLLDFGQSRQYIDPHTGQVRPAREHADFRGTSIYSSLNAHYNRDLGRRDDLWSLFYVWVDMCRGGLPWRIWKDERSRCQALKAFYMSSPARAKELVADLLHPEIEAQFAAIQEHLMTLKFEDKPDYGFLAESLRKCYSVASEHSLLDTRPRPPYPDSHELGVVLSTFSNVPSARAGGGGGAQVGIVEEGEVGASVVAPVFVPGTGRSASAVISPPPLSSSLASSSSSSSSSNNSSDLATTTTSETTSSTTTTTTSSSGGVNVIDFDIDNTPLTCDGVLESRRGKWRSLEYNGIPLVSLLSVADNQSGTSSSSSGSSSSSSSSSSSAGDASSNNSTSTTTTTAGSVSTAALNLQRQLEDYAKGCVQVLAGWEEEEQNGVGRGEGGGDDADDADQSSDDDDEEEDENDENGDDDDDDERQQYADGSGGGKERNRKRRRGRGRIEASTLGTTTTSASSSAAVHTPPRYPSWLTSHRRPPTSTSIGGTKIAILPPLAEASPQALVRHVRRKLRHLSTSLFWGAATALTAATDSLNSSATATTTTTTTTAATAAAIEYVSAWSTLATAVSSSPITRACVAQDSATTTSLLLSSVSSIAEVRSMMSSLAAAVTGEGIQPHIPSSSGKQGSSSQNTTTTSTSTLTAATIEDCTIAAQKALEMLRHSEGCFFDLPTKDKEASSSSTTTGMAADGGESSSTSTTSTSALLSLRAQKALGSVEQWLSASSANIAASTTPTTTGGAGVRPSQSSIGVLQFQSNESSSSGGSSSSSGGSLMAGFSGQGMKSNVNKGDPDAGNEGDEDTDEETGGREARDVARRDLARVIRLLIALGREREILRPATFSEATNAFLRKPVPVVVSSSAAPVSVRSTGQAPGTLEHGGSSSSNNNDNNGNGGGHGTAQYNNNYHNQQNQMYSGNPIPPFASSSGSSSSGSGSGSGGSNNNTNSAMIGAGNGGGNNNSSYNNSNNNGAVGAAYAYVSDAEMEIDM